jgi:hypothetical protein
MAGGEAGSPSRNGILQFGVWERGPSGRVFYLVRPAGRTHLEVKVLYTPGKGKC